MRPIKNSNRCPYCNSGKLTKKGGPQKEARNRAALQMPFMRSRLHPGANRALELFDLTLMGPCWHGRLREIGRAREVFCDAALGGKEYGSTLESLEPYFDQFALAARSRPK